MTSRWDGRSVLVTGGTGLLGGWTIDALLDRGARVVALIRDWLPDSMLIGSGTLSRVTAVDGDIRDLACVERALSDHDVEGVVHLAAQTLVGLAVEEPLATFESNIKGTWNVLDACRRTPRVRAVVVASSDKAYGSTDALPYRESTPLRGRHPYDVSKACTDLLAQAYAATYETPAVILRCGNLYGGGDLNWSRLVPGTIRSALRGERPIIRSDGTFVREYLYAEDAAAAYLAALDAMDERRIAAGDAFNVAADEPHAVLEMVRRIIAAVGAPGLEPDVQGTARHEIPRQQLDSSRARDVLGWRPSTPLDAGLARTVEWYRRLEARAR